MVLKNRSNKGRSAIFLETSAQILRLVGGRELSREIDALISTFRTVGSSQFVLREFQLVYGGLYDQMEAAIEALPDQHRPRAFDKLWLEMHDVLPIRVAGGRDLLSRISSRLCAAFGREIVTPMYVRNLIAGQKRNLLKNFKRGDHFFDSSSCCVWPDTALTRCIEEPGVNCRLQAICIERRKQFLESSRTVARARVSESEVMQKHMEQVAGLDGRQLMNFVGKHPNIFGDLIIFWEIPDYWTILSRDRLFPILTKVHRKETICVYRPRWPRKGSGSKCKVELVRDESNISGSVLNYSPKGACVLTKQRVAIGTKVLLHCREFAGRRGIIVWVDPQSRGFIHGIKLPLKGASSAER